MKRINRVENKGVGPKKKTILALLLCGPLAGCGTGRETSNGTGSLKGVVSDLEEDGSTSDRKELYFVSQSTILRQQCPANARVYTPVTCDARKQRMPYADFKKILDNGLSAEVKFLTDEATRLEKMMSEVQLQIKKLQAEIDRIEQGTGGLSDELRKLRAEVTRLDAWIESAREQVRAINQRLSSMPSDDLLAQRDYVLNEIMKLEKELTATSRRVEELTQQLSTVSPQIAALNEEISKLTTRSNQLQSQLVEVNKKLQSATSDLSVYKETLAYIEDSPIIYIVTSDTTWWKKVRKFVKRFDTIFDNNAA